MTGRGDPVGVGRVQSTQNAQECKTARVCTRAAACLAGDYMKLSANRLSAQTNMSS